MRALPNDRPGMRPSARPAFGSNYLLSVSNLALALALFESETMFGLLLYAMYSSGSVMWEAFKVKVTNFRHLLRCPSFANTVTGYAFASSLIASFDIPNSIKS